MRPLDWPAECARAWPGDARFAHAGSNLCLDFHGDPLRAGAVVFSDGNHHMALEEGLRQFVAAHPEVIDVFYATTPPRAVVEALRAGALQVGNLRLSLRPHVFVSPPAVLDALLAAGLLAGHAPLAESLCNVLLVRKGNPKAVSGVADLAREDVRLFLSNPRTETVSYRVYAETLRRKAQAAGVALDFLDPPEQSRGRVEYGELIHHREAPQAVADGRADAALVFHHLALRYTRIFPETFEMVALGPVDGSDPDNVKGITHLGVVGDGGAWGARLRDFLLGAECAAIYARHGLRHAAAALT